MDRKLCLRSRVAFIFAGSLPHCTKTLVAVPEAKRAASVQHSPETKTEPLPASSGSTLSDDARERSR